MLGVGDFLMAAVDLVPLRGWNLVFVATVVEVGEVRVVRLGRDFARHHLERLRQSLLDALLLGYELGIAAQQNVGAAAAMLVEIVIAPLRPAWATISASFSWYLAFSTTCLMPFFFSRSDRRSDFSTEVVPTRMGCPFSAIFWISSDEAKNFSFSVRYTTSEFSTRSKTLFVGMTTTSSL